VSAFLGPIHSWLYHKIRLQEELVQAVLQIAKENCRFDNIEEKVAQECGVLESGNLEDIVDENNIHGWLQERVSLVEKRLAYAVTLLAKEDERNIELVKEAAFRFGKAHAINSDAGVREAYTHLENMLLNGMPCDQVNHILYEEDNRMKWEQTVDIHAKYWNMAGGDNAHYNWIRESLIRGILEGSRVEFDQEDKNVFVIQIRANMI